MKMQNNWPTKKLTDICDLERGTEPGSAFYIEASDKAISFLRVGDLTGKVDAPKFVKNDNGHLQIVNENETLITFDGTPGIVVRGLKGAISSGVRVVRNIKPDINENFLFYYLQTPNVQKTIKAYSKGATIIHASAAIPHIKIPIPPLKIQKQIVERLDKIIVAQKLNNELIQKSDELFQSLFYSEYELKSDKWNLKKLQEFCGKIEQIHPKKIFKNEFSYIDIASINDERIISAQIISVDKAPSRARKVVKTGDTIFSTVRPYLRHIAYIPKMLNNSIASTGFCVIRPSINLADPFFLNYIVESNYFVKKVLPFQHGANYPAVSDKNIYGIKIPLPPLKIQKQIVEKLSAVQEYKNQLLAQRAKLKELFDSILHKSMKNE